MVAVEKQNDPLTLIHSDALSALRTLEDESVQCCVTSPPYWGLRDYGHEWQIGLEKTPEDYVARLVEIFRELKRVLRPDGTLWLNLGDSYAGSGRGGNPPESKWAGFMGNKERERSAQPHLHSAAVESGAIGRNWVKPPDGLKSKDLVGIPWMVAFALRADGWYLRSDIIWSKPNPMPESVTDRPTKSHEYIFLLSKSERYYYNAAAIAEPLDRPEELDRATPARFGGANKWPEAQKQSRLHSGNEYKRKPWTPYMGSYGVARDGLNRAQDRNPNAPTRNKRSVWRIGTTPYRDAHFATFPTEIPSTCILAGSKAGDAVIDCFAGSGTTGKVAIELGRKAILIEPKAEYVGMIKRRCQTTIGLPLAI